MEKRTVIFKLNCLLSFVQHQTPAGAEGDTDANLDGLLCPCHCCSCHHLQQKSLSGWWTDGGERILCNFYEKS